MDKLQLHFFAEHIKEAELSKESSKKLLAALGLSAALGTQATDVGRAYAKEMGITNNPAIQHVMAMPSDMEAARAHTLYRKRGGKGALFSPEYSSDKKLEALLQHRQDQKGALKRFRDEGGKADSYYDMNIYDQERHLKYASKKKQRKYSAAEKALIAGGGLSLLGLGALGAKMHSSAKDTEKIISRVNKSVDSSNAVLKRSKKSKREKELDKLTSNAAATPMSKNLSDRLDSSGFGD